MERNKNNIPQLDRRDSIRLKNLCYYQYPRWKKELEQLNNSLGVSGINNDGMPRGTDVSFPTERNAIRLVVLQKKISCVEEAAERASPDLAKYVLFYCTNRDTSFEDLENKKIPCSRATFFRCRKMFFRHLKVLLND